MSVGLYHWGLISDHKKRRTCIVFHPDISESLKNNILRTIDQVVAHQTNSSFKLLDRFIPTQSRTEYLTAFQQIQDYIAAGDCYEVNLTQRFKAPYSGDSWQAFKNSEPSPKPLLRFLYLVLI